MSTIWTKRTIFWWHVSRIRKDELSIVRMNNISCHRTHRLNEINFLNSFTFQKHQKKLKKSKIQLFHFETNFPCFMSFLSAFQCIQSKFEYQVWRFLFLFLHKLYVSFSFFSFVKNFLRQLTFRHFIFGILLPFQTTTKVHYFQNCDWES